MTITTTIDKSNNDHPWGKRLKAKFYVQDAFASHSRPSGPHRTAQRTRTHQLVLIDIVCLSLVWVVDVCRPSCLFCPLWVRTTGKHTQAPVYPTAAGAPLRNFAVWIRKTRTTQEEHEERGRTRNAVLHNYNGSDNSNHHCCISQRQHCTSLTHSISNKDSDPNRTEPITRSYSPCPSRSSNSGVRSTFGNIKSTPCFRGNNSQQNHRWIEGRGIIRK